jgi:hypothetical protein
MHGRSDREKVDLIAPGGVGASNSRGALFRMASALVKASATIAVSRCACSSKDTPRRARNRPTGRRGFGPGSRRLFHVDCLSAKPHNLRMARAALSRTPTRVPAAL